VVGLGQGGDVGLPDATSGGGAEEALEDVRAGRMVVVEAKVRPRPKKT